MMMMMREYDDIMVSYLYDFYLATCSVDISFIVTIEPDFLDTAIKDWKCSVNTNLNNKNQRGQAGIIFI